MWMASLLHRNNEQKKCNTFILYIFRIFFFVVALVATTMAIAKQKLNYICGTTILATLNTEQLYFRAFVCQVIGSKCFFFGTQNEFRHIFLRTHKLFHRVNWMNDLSSRPEDAKKMREQTHTL